MKIPETRIKKAMEDYMKKDWTGTVCEFNDADVTQIASTSQWYIEALYHALMAGYTLGDNQSKANITGDLQELKNGHDIVKAYEQYKNTKRRGTEGQFYPFDLEAIRDMFREPSRPREAILYALRAGAMIGYRHGKKAAKKCRENSI